MRLAARVPAVSVRHRRLRVRRLRADSEVRLRVALVVLRRRKVADSAVLRLIRSEGPPRGEGVPISAGLRKANTARRVPAAMVRLLAVATVVPRRVARRRADTVARRRKISISR